MDYSEIQKLLKAAGFYTGNIDGVFGKKSKAALEACIQRASDPDLSEARVKEAVAKAAEYVFGKLGQVTGN